MFADERAFSSRRLCTLFCIATAREDPLTGGGPDLPPSPREAIRARYSACAAATRFSSSDNLRRSISRRISGVMSSVSSSTWPSSLRPSVASEPAIGVNSLRSDAAAAGGVRDPGAPGWLDSNRLNASPNLPAKMDEDFLPREERLVRLLSSLFLGLASSMDRRNSTFDSILVSSASRSRSGDGSFSIGLSFGEGNLGEPGGFELASCSRRKSKLDSR